MHKGNPPARCSNNTELEEQEPNALHSAWPRASGNKTRSQRDREAEAAAVNRQPRPTPQGRLHHRGQAPRRPQHISRADSGPVPLYGNEPNSTEPSSATTGWLPNCPSFALLARLPAARRPLYTRSGCDSAVRGELRLLASGDSPGGNVIPFVCQSGGLGSRGIGRRSLLLS